MCELIVNLIRDLESGLLDKYNVKHILEEEGIEETMFKKLLYNIIENATSTVLYRKSILGITDEKLINIKVLDCQYNVITIS